MKSHDAGQKAENAPESVWQPGSAQTRWGSLSAPPDAIMGPSSKGRRGEPSHFFVYVPGSHHSTAILQVF